jgi:hypothetical protein
MESGSQILVRMRELSAQEQPLILLNTYRGVPVVTTARITNVSSGYVAVNVHEYQAVCMSMDGNTHVQSDYLSQAYQAEAVAVDVLKKQAILTDFVPVEEGIGRRVNVRVRPENPMDVEISGEDFSISGKIADISTSGVGIYTLAAYVYGEMPMDQGEAVYVDIKLPNISHPLRLPGEVTNLIYHEGNIIQRIGVRIDAGIEQLTELQDYVSVREQAILHELRLIYETIRRDSEKRR